MTDDAATRQALIEEILAGMRVLVQGIRRTFPTTADELDITMRQCRAIMLLAEAPVSMSKLAAAVGASLPSTTGLVDRLVQRGLVSRHEDPNDRRLVICELTTRGRQVISTLQDADREVFTQLFQGLSAPELETVREAVDILRKQLEGQQQAAVPVAPRTSV